MDPYRPNQYGFRPPPPGPFGNQQQRFPPPVVGMRPPPLGGMPPQQQPYNNNFMGNRPPPSLSTIPPASSIATTNPLPASPVNGTNSSSTSTDPANEKLTTLFVGAIASGIADDWIEKLLQTCGNLIHWKRTKDSAGNPKGFGFATYGDPDSVLCALRILGGETTSGVTLIATDGSNVSKKLIVKADDTVRQYLESYQNQKTAALDQDESKYQLVTKYISAISNGQEVSAHQEESLDAMDKELAFFKEQAQQRDDRRDRYEEGHTSRKESYDYKRGFVKGPVEHSNNNYTNDLISDQELEQRRKENHERDVELAFHQREKRFERKQNMKLYEYEKDLRQERDQEIKAVKEKEYWLDRLALWDDTAEREKGNEVYYANISEWEKMRNSIRRRERENDKEDKRREDEELELENIRLEEEERQKKDMRFLTRTEEDPKIALKPKKLNFNLPIKRNTLGGVDEDEEEEAKKKRRVLVPLDYGDIDKLKSEDDEDEQKELSTEERAKKVKELIDSIPSSQNELWSYNVRWDQVDENLIETKLQPFVSKKILEALGMEDDDIVKFVLDFIRKKNGAKDLVSELEGALEDDALVFVMKFWRALIFETERKFKKL